jgi:hypothetical protein
MTNQSMIDNRAGRTLLSANGRCKINAFSREAA